MLYNECTVLCVWGKINVMQKWNWWKSRDINDLFIKLTFNKVGVFHLCSVHLIMNLLVLIISLDTIRACKDRILTNIISSFHSLVIKEKELTFKSHVCGSSQFQSGVIMLVSSLSSSKQPIPNRPLFTCSFISIQPRHPRQRRTGFLLIRAAWSQSPLL